MESSSEGLWYFSQIHYAFTHTLFKCHDISECLAILKTLLCRPPTTSQQKELRLGAFSSVIISVSHYSTQNLNATALKPVRLQRQIFVNMSLGWMAKFGRKQTKNRKLELLSELSSLKNDKKIITEKLSIRSPMIWDKLGLKLEGKKFGLRKTSHSESLEWLIST